jgi:hypothetical protein
LATRADRGYRCGDARLSLVNVVGGDLRASLGSEALGLGGPNDRRRRHDDGIVSRKASNQ